MPIAETVIEPGMMAVVGEEVFAEKASEADSAALAEAHFTLLSFISTDEEVLEALEILVSSVENQHSMPNQINSGVAAAIDRGVVTSEDMIRRIAALEGLASLVAGIRHAPLDLLVALAVDTTDTRTAQVARATLTKGPVDASEKPRWATVVGLLPDLGAEADPEQILATVEMLFS